MIDTWFKTFDLFYVFDSNNQYKVYTVIYNLISSKLYNIYNFPLNWIYIYIYVQFICPPKLISLICTIYNPVSFH